MPSSAGIGMIEKSALRRRRLPHTPPCVFWVPGVPKSISVLLVGLGPKKHIRWIKMNYITTGMFVAAFIATFAPARQYIG